LLSLLFFFSVGGWLVGGSVVIAIQGIDANLWYIFFLLLCALLFWVVGWGDN